MNTDIYSNTNPYYDFGSYPIDFNKNSEKNQTLILQKTIDQEDQPMASSDDWDTLTKNEEPSINNEYSPSSQETEAFSTFIPIDKDVNLILDQIGKKPKNLLPKIIKSRLEKENNKMPTANNHLGIAKTSHRHIYGKNHNPQDGHSSCEHCHEREHEFIVVSSPESNCLIEKFQTSYQRVIDEYHKRAESPNSKKKYKFTKEDGMAGAAIVKKNGKIVAQYITTSGGANGKMRDVYKLMQNDNKAKILDYDFHPETEKTIDRQGSLYAIFTKSSLRINQGKFMNFYGKEIKTIGSLAINMEEGNIKKLPAVDSKYPNFTICCAQKIFQQIAKDFGQEIKHDPKSFSISLSEAWFKSSGEYKYRNEKRIKNWSMMHPVPSCDSCSFVLPKSLCKNSN